MINLIGIFGYPLKHTLSPLMHNAAFAALRLPYYYVPFEIKPQRFTQAVSALRTLNLAGANITLPFKERVMPLLDRIDLLARRIGSVNTIVNSNGKLVGYNTDGTGFLRDLKTHRISCTGRNVLLIGAGGAGRALAATLSMSKARKIYITDVDVQRARKLAVKVPRAFSIVRSGLEKLVQREHITLCINATPLGMHPGDPSPIPARLLRKDMFIYDIVYNRPTRLLAYAKKMRIPHASGIGMLLYQGMSAFELWTCRKAPEQLMRTQLIKALRKYK